MNSTITQALQGLYKKMTGETANGKTKVQILNEISASMGATKNSYTTAKCINDITDNYTPGGGGGGESMLEQVTWTYEWDAVYEAATFIVEASYNDCASIIASGKVPYFEITAEKAAEVNALVGYEWLLASKYVLTDMYDDEYNWVNFNMLGYIGYSVSFNFSPATKTEYLKAS